MAHFMSKMTRCASQRSTWSKVEKHANKQFKINTFKTKNNSYLQNKFKIRVEASPKLGVVHMAPTCQLYIVLRDHEES